MASKLKTPAFGSSGLISSTAPGWFSDQTVHTVTMLWTTLHLSPIGDVMCASKTSTRTRRTHTFVQGLLAHATSAASAFQKASLRHIGLTCPSLVCDTCRRRKVQDMEQHRKECPGPPNVYTKQCTNCRQYIDKNKFDEHFEACEYWYCRYCLMAIVALGSDEHRKIYED